MSFILFFASWGLWATWGVTIRSRMCNYNFRLCDNHSIMQVHLPYFPGILVNTHAQFSRCFEILKLFIFYAAAVVGVLDWQVPNPPGANPLVAERAFRATDY